MTIFSYINDILYTKKGDLLDNIDNESQYNSYMINRWISMYSPQVAQLVNLTSNRLYSSFKSKEDNYKFLINIIPKSKFRRINYIKKASKDKHTDDEAVEMLAKNVELSKREIRYYIDQGSITLPKI
tara:strand:- start:42 stop:422 length:381 start_codon:yes stop_codon:yes gene_type:complete